VDLSPLWHDEELDALFAAAQGPMSGLTDPDEVPTLISPITMRSRCVRAVVAVEERRRPANLREELEIPWISATSENAAARRSMDERTVTAARLGRSAEPA
jgi:hypothetical protein